MLRIELAGSYTTAPRFARCFDWASACRFRQGCCLQRFSETKATSAHAKVALLNKVHATRGFVLSQRLLSQQFRVAMGPCTTIPFDWVQDGRLSPAPTLSRHDPSSPTSRRKGNSKRKLTDDGSCSPWIKSWRIFDGDWSQRGQRGIKGELGTGCVLALE